MAQTRELVQALGVPHQVLSVEWDDGVAAVLSRGRSRGYRSLLEYCKSTGAQALMTAHHLDDQIGEHHFLLVNPHQHGCVYVASLLFRMGRGSDTSGLAGMHDIGLNQYVHYLQVQLVHPFLRCRKEQLVAVCKEAGLKWVENLTNSHAHVSKHYIAKLLEKDPALRQGLYHMHTTLNWTRTQALHGKGMCMATFTPGSSK